MNEIVVLEKRKNQQLCEKLCLQVVHRVSIVFVTASLLFMRCIIKTLDEYVCEYDIQNFKIRDNDLNYRKNMSIIFHYSYENDTYSKTFESTTIGFLAYYLLYKYLDSGKLRLLATCITRGKKRKHKT